MLGAERRAECMGLKHKRILLKLSGEALCGVPGGFGLEPKTLETISAELADVHALGTQIAIVIGGGNIFRGLKGSAAGHGSRQRRLHGHAGDRDQRHRAAGRAGEARRADAADDRARSAQRRRAVHPPPCAASPREGPHADLRRGHRQSRTSPPTPRLRCARWRSKPTCCARRPRSKACSTKIPPSTPTRTCSGACRTTIFIQARMGVMDSTAVTLCRDNNLPIRVFALGARGNIQPRGARASRSVRWSARLPTQFANQAD